MLVLALLLNKFKPAVWFGMCARVPCGAVLGMYMCLYTVDFRRGFLPDGVWPYALRTERFNRTKCG